THIKIYIIISYHNINIYNRTYITNHAQDYPKKNPYRNLYRVLDLSIPIHPDYEMTTISVGSHPNMLNGTRFLNIRNYKSLSSLDLNRRIYLPALTDLTRSICSNSHMLIILIPNRVCHGTLSLFTGAIFRTNRSRVRVGRLGVI